MSLSIGSLGTLSRLPRLPVLPEIQIVIPNPFQKQSNSTPTNQSKTQTKSLKEKLQEVLDNAKELSLIPNGVWEGLLRAVPKKKVSHSRKRNRQLTGSKQLKLLNNLNRCPSCGHIKRSHHLCMHCVEQIRSIWRTDAKESKQEPYKQELNDQDRKLIYPGKKESDYEKMLKDKKNWLERRQRTFELNRRR
ncbi:hypothetical protein WICMUC_004282 [Wickerhamomyces mucosus]|uniref:Large ribosomal subunit protein bL32m n=1 Tax=Wickerhamomyces mucosus TaxID=1378264 RepID=A0A9P8PHX0_9ASCO|nr:hypothetical protein WICMUC_004282 [Wickerhamomyces mucosus]